MKVIMLNGSSHQKGCTNTALNVIADELEKQAIESEIVWIGNKPIQGCIGCWQCKKGNSHCVFEKDLVNEVIEKMNEADGIILGSPVQFASAAGHFTAFLDRLFMAGADVFKFKPATAICSARRAGTTATFHQLLDYITMNQMIVSPSPYWNMVHGNQPEEVMKDEEGLYIMRSVAAGMAWIIKMKEATKEIQPVAMKSAKTNFIR